MLKKLMPLLPVLLFCGCTHIKGTVVDEVTGRPVRTAIVSIGRPDDIAQFETHRVDSSGKFDFQMSNLDFSNVYVYDSVSPTLTLVHIEQADLGTNMKVKLSPPPRQEPAMPTLH